MEPIKIMANGDVILLTLLTKLANMLCTGISRKKTVKAIKAEIIPGLIRFLIIIFFFFYYFAGEKLHGKTDLY